ncbi:MAG TPA: amino acid adenylation domain-containing protein, partial [Pyrinomonadaceae bacterium]|nr:amino acid adenylation domain-containing protein [Pyrinomonadaceae bacterium]
MTTSYPTFETADNAAAHADEQEVFVLPLSFAQQRLWFLDQLEPGNPFYNMPSALRLSGSLRVGALRRALEEVVRRHEVLRTTFSVMEGEPVQVIREAASVSLPVIDLSSLPQVEREAEAEMLARDEAARPFDLERGPLVRASLLKLTEQEHLLLLTMHHIISDGWSMGVLVREVAALYEGYSRGGESPLAELAVQYGDYAVWQREHLRGEVLDSQLTYWKQQLAGAPAALELPTDRPRPAVQTYRGAQHDFALPKAVAEGLRELGRAEGATLYMTLLAGWQALLARYSNQEDISVGSPIAGRQRSEMEGLIGFFVNTLVMRARVSGEESFTSLLGRVREVCLGAYAHQDVPFEKLVEELQPERDPSRSPLFQVAFALQNTPPSRLALPGLQLSVVEPPVKTAKFDLTLVLTEGPEGLEGSAVYNTDLFDAATVRRMVEQYGRLLAGVAADPRRRVGDLSLLSEAESRQVLRDWNDTATDYPRAECLHELFERQAARTPEAAAVVYGAQSLTYAELNQRANRLARHLRALGVGPGAMVGLCVERSAEMVVALLAILKAGGAYVPLDPQYPAERLAFMIEDAAVPVLLTQQSLRASLPADESRAVLCLDTEWHLVAGLPAENLPNLNAADELAYVIYTSGSTGKPKGVCVPHRAVSRLVFDTNYVSLRPDDRMAQVSNSSFDAATFEIWGALLHGAQLVGISKDVALAPLELAARIKEERVGVMFLTTALFNQIARAMPDAFASMRYVLFGGEAADPNSVREVALNGPPEHLMNVYGPTENTTFSTWFRVREVAEGVHTIPIGAPISNTRAYVLDRRQRPVPVGVAGELYLGGDGLARDYLNRPALTAERFVPDPFTDEPGARLYRTGDLVRFLADGQIEFVGRIDQQVKIRGFRIELGEIEAVLNEHESVSESVVVAREDAPGERRLVGYLTGAPGLKIGDVRSYLKERLPDYMVPSFFVLLDELPLTVNGKVDRRRLPEPSREAAAGERERARTAAEEMVANVFGQVLKVGAVGVGESFFELGGHSLLATQVMSRVREAFGVELPLRTLFEHPTVGELSRRIEQAIGEGQGTPAPPVTRASRSGSLPLSFAQQRLWFVDQLEPGSTSYNVPAAVRLTGALDVTALERTLAEIVRRHEVLRTTFSVMNGEPVQVINEARPVSLPVIDLSHMEEAEREAEAVRLAREEAALPFDLATGPLVRASLVRLSGKE